MRTKTYTCKLCGEIFPNPISVARHRKADHNQTPSFIPQSVAELEKQFEELRAKIDNMILYERSMADSLQTQIAEHETNAEKLSTLLATVNEFAKVA
jgi:hypothetical protein